MLMGFATIARSRSVSITPCKSTNRALLINSVQGGYYANRSTSAPRFRVNPRCSSNAGDRGGTICASIACATADEYCSVPTSPSDPPPPPPRKTGKTMAAKSAIALSGWSLGVDLDAIATLLFSILCQFKVTCLNDPSISLLARSGGRRPTDSFEVFPVPERDSQGQYHVHFFAHALRYLPTESRQRIHTLQIGDELHLLHDLQNSVDSRALLLRTQDLQSAIVPATLCKTFLS